MSNIVPFEGSTDFYKALLNTLEDLAQFGIRIQSSNPNFMCVCGARFDSNWSQGYGYDNLCPTCYDDKGPTHDFRNRIYTNRTVYVSDPLTYEDTETQHHFGDVRQQVFRSRLYGFVVIDRQLCLISARVNKVGDKDWSGFDSCDLLDIATGEEVEQCALHLSYWKLNELRQTQTPL